MNGKNSVIKRVSWCLVSCVLIALGVAMLNIAHFGNDPYSAMINSFTLFMSFIPEEYTFFHQYSYLICNTVFSLLLAIPILFITRKYFNIGTFLNIFGMSYVIDLFMLLFSYMGLTTSLPLYGRIISVVLGFIIESIGVALFVQSNVGVAPYDALNVLIGKKITYKYSRILCDVGATLIAFIISLCFHLDLVTDFVSFVKFLFLSPENKVGWFTYFLFFAGGPMISIFGKLANKYIFKTEKANI